MGSKLNGVGKHDALHYQFLSQKSKSVTLRFLVIALCSLLASCGESGSDNDGPFMAYLVLQDVNGTIRDFELGGYARLEKCIGVIAYEAGNYERERNRKFYTNADFDYGGYRADGLTVEHVIVGAKCIEQR